MEWCSKITVKSNVSQECVEYENFNYNFVSWYVGWLFFLNQDASGSVWRCVYIINNRPVNEEQINTGIKEAMLDELRLWFEEFCSEPMNNAPAEILALYEWFEEYHRRQFTPDKNALIL